MMRQVFDEPRVSRDEHLSGTEPLLHWFSQSTRPDAAEGRRVVNDMYSRFPDDAGRLFAELHARDDRRLCSALDELLVHDLLARQYRVTYEEGEGSKPDFRLYQRAGGDYVGAVEVMTLFQREEWAAELQRHTVLSEEINRRVVLTTHSVDFQIDRWDGTPSVRHIGGWLQATIAALQADPTSLALGELNEPKKVYRSVKADITFRFLPLPSTYVVKPGDSIVVTGPVIGGLVDSAQRLRERLDGKAVKYDLAGKPFAIVAGIRDSMCDLGEVHEALVGTSAVVIATGEGVRKGDGFFGNGRLRAVGKHQRVSAVFSIHEWFPGGPYRPRITRFDNPFAALPFPNDAVPHGGRWGVLGQEDHAIRAGWLAPGQAPIPS